MDIRIHKHKHAVISLRELMGPDSEAVEKLFRKSFDNRIKCWAMI